MHTIVKKWEEQAAPKKDWSRILTNKMTIVGWKMYRSDRVLHFGFILYRLKKDLGFTEWEIANLTGIPVKDINNMMLRFRPQLESDILKELAKINWQEDEHEWRSVPAYNTPQGYVIKKNKPWYENGYPPQKIKGEPVVKLGAESEQEFERKLNAKKK